MLVLQPKLSVTHLVVIPDATLAPVLCWHTGKLDAFTQSFFSKRILFPPAQLFNTLTAGRMHPCPEASRYKPAQTGTEALVQLHNWRGVQMVEVIVTDDDAVNVWQLSYAARCWAITHCNARQSNWTAPVTEHGICQNSDVVHLKQHSSMTDPCHC